MVDEYKLGTKLPLAAASEGVGSLALGIFPPFINRRQVDPFFVIVTRCVTYSSSQGEYVKLEESPV